jgi:hypothetical protein
MITSKIKKWESGLIMIYIAVGLLTSCTTLQKPDKRYNVAINKPTYTKQYPTVLYDEAHLNTHTSKGTYKPFVDLISNDGYKVYVNKHKFSIQLLETYDLLVICNAKSDKNLPRDIGAFTAEECKAVTNWVREGGSLLLIADHHPFGLANMALASSFGVKMGGGSVKNGSVQDGQLEFSRSNGLLGEHAITNGLNKIVTFTGQSLGGNAVSLLKFGANATEVRPDSIWQQEGKNYIRFGKPESVAGLSQAMALEYGKGRVVVLGDAAMISAQKLFGRRFGMNYPVETDNKQFALNLMHWLTKKAF